MEEKQYGISDSTVVAIPLRNLIAMVFFVAVSVFGYAQITNKLIDLDHRVIMQEADIANNSDFRIRWPLGELGTLPADAQQDLMIKHYGNEIAKLEAITTEQAEEIEVLKSRLMRLELYVEQHQDWILRVQTKAESALDQIKNLK